MKLRILNDSVRLRLSIDDMQNLFTNDACTAICSLPGNDLCYSISIVNDQKEIDIINNSKELLVSIPYTMFKDFFNSTEEGLYYTKSWKENNIKIAIERDFKCLTPRSENEERLYENPRDSH